MPVRAHEKNLRLALEFIYACSLLLSPEILAKYEPVIGLEVHVQLLTATKAFCGCANKFGAEPEYEHLPGVPGAAGRACRF